MQLGEWKSMGEEAGQIWEELAGFWDDYMGDEGNDFHRQLIVPTVDSLLAPKAGERILEIGCGAGLYSRHLAQLGAQVMATDISPTFLERASRRAGDLAHKIDFRRVDATDREALLRLEKGSFDGVVSNMVLMDIAALEPLFSAVSRLLRPQGRFVFTLMHPCFQAPYSRRVAEEADVDGTIVHQFGIRVTHYITPVHHRGLGIPGQPRAQSYFHRPLSVLLRRCFEAGFVVDGLEEPHFSGEQQPRRAFSWNNYSEIPPVLAVRLRL